MFKSTLRLAPLTLGCLTLWAAVAGAQPSVEFAKVPPAKLTLGSSVSLEWHGSAQDLQYRYQLAVPEDWLKGARYVLNRWTEWDTVTSVRYTDFIIEGAYTFSVQARDPKTGRTSPTVAHRFNMYFMMPELFSEAVKIDMGRVQGAASPAERNRILAEEFRTASSAWRQKLDYQLQVLKATVTVEELLGPLGGLVVKTGELQLLEWGTRAAVAKAVRQILLPQTLYGLVKQFGLDVVLILRRSEANQALCMAVLTDLLRESYERKAAAEALPGSRSEPVKGSAAGAGRTPPEAPSGSLAARGVTLRFMAWVRTPALESWPKDPRSLQQKLPFLSRDFIRAVYRLIKDDADFTSPYHPTQTVVRSVVVRGNRAEAIVETSLGAVWMPATARNVCSVPLVLEDGRWRVDDYPSIEGFEHDWLGRPK